MHPALRRRRLLLLDHLVKRNALRSLVVAGVGTDEECKGLLQWNKHLRFVLVWAPPPVRQPSDRVRNANALQRMRAWERSYGRFDVLEMPTAKAVETLADREFDCVALWSLTPQQLAAEGPLWAARVKDGGLLVGVDYREVAVRQILNAAVPRYDRLRDGVWCVRVRRTSQSEDVGDPVSDAHGLEDGGQLGAAGPDQVIAVEDGITAGGELVPDALANVRQASVGQDGHQPVASEAVAADTLPQPAPKRRGGRPKGSRNKPKVAAE